MFLDVAKIYIKAGNGGNGKVSFFRAKHNMCGGPDGGDGGRGGDIVFEADKNLNTLIDFKYRAHYRAENGVNGDRNNAYGRSGQTLIIKVPAGTIIKDYESGKVIADMLEDGFRKVVLKGGRGGKGNARFATPTRRSPAFAQNGVTTEQKCVTLELKTIADIGLVGFPNVGKSTLLSVLTEAKPKIASYHFTTLAPNLGVIRVNDNSYVIADIPGLIEGANEGVGLGHKFLRHIERVRMLVHILDISGSEQREPAEDYFKIRKELELYDQELTALPELVVGNKTDLCGADAVCAAEKIIGKKIFPMSAIIHEGVKEFLEELIRTVSSLPEKSAVAEVEFEYSDKDETSYEITGGRDTGFEVSGGLIDMLIRNVTLSNPESNRYFQAKLKERGVFEELKALGAKDGDTIHIADIEFEYIE